MLGLGDLRAGRGAISLRTTGWGLERHGFPVAAARRAAPAWQQGGGCTRLLEDHRRHRQSPSRSCRPRCRLARDAESAVEVQPALEPLGQEAGFGAEPSQSLYDLQPDRRHPRVAPHRAEAHTDRMNPRAAGAARPTSSPPNGTTPARPDHDRFETFYFIIRARRRRRDRPAAVAAR